MIRVAITGAETPIAGELIRILIHHPDVELAALVSSLKRGHAVTALHHGLIGDTEMVAQAEADLSDVDVIFVCNEDDEAERWLEEARKTEDLRIIDLSHRHLEDYSDSDMEFGLSEIYRKPLVRGAKRAVVPDPITASVLVALYPLAANGLLPVSSEIVVEGAHELEQYCESASRLVSQHLSRVQPDAMTDVEIDFRVSRSDRGLRVNTSVPTMMKREDIERAYDEIYDDHNFTFLLSEPKDFCEVEGTNKCLISLRKVYDNSLEVDAIIDHRLRGGAGEAVHVMNLLFGLHECTGLTLKASTF